MAASHKTLIYINGDGDDNGSNNHSMDEVLAIIETAKHKNQIVIITDPKIVNSNETRRVVHEKCEEIGITSNSIKPSGASGIRMVIQPISPYIHRGLSYEELAMFSRMTKLQIDKRLHTNEEIFLYKMRILDDFHVKYGKPNSVSPNEFQQMFLKVKEVATNNNKSVGGYIAYIEGQMVDAIKNTEEYQTYNQVKMKKIKREPQRDPVSGIMKGTNPYRIDIKSFWGISIDIIKANFNVLRLVGAIKTKTWSDFVEQFTDLGFFVHAKVFRQQMMGKLNTRRIMNTEKEYLRALILMLQEANIEVDGNINSDEIIISSTEDKVKDLYGQIREVITQHPHPAIWRVSIFNTQPLLEHSTSGFYPFVRYNINDPNDFSNCWVEFRCGGKEYHTQLIKYWLHSPIEDGDLKWADYYGNIHTFDYAITES